MHSASTHVSASFFPPTILWHAILVRIPVRRHVIHKKHVSKVSVHRCTRRADVDRCRGVLAEGGEESAALLWLQRVPETATPAFVGKMVSFLRASRLAGLRGLAAAIEHAA